MESAIARRDGGEKRGQMLIMTIVDAFDNEPMGRLCFDHRTYFMFGCL